MTGRRLSRATTNADVMAWVDAQLAKGARLRAQVEVRLNGLRLEQQLTTLREARGLSQRQVVRRVVTALGGAPAGRGRSTFAPQARTPRVAVRSRRRSRLR
jgi:hypothetical protein